MSSPKESKPPEPPVPERNSLAAVKVASPEVANGKASIAGQGSVKPATEQLAAFALSAQEVKAAAEKEITKRTAPTASRPERRLWKRAQRERQAELELEQARLASQSVIVAQRKSFFTQKQREEMHRVRVEKEDLLNQIIREDITARRTYARQIFTLITSWLSAILFVLLLQGYSSGPTALFLFHWRNSQWKIGRFQLSEPVLLALIGGTTASVLGLFAIVAKYFFPEKKDGT